MKTITKILLIIIFFLKLTTVRSQDHPIILSAQFHKQKYVHGSKVYLDVHYKNNGDTNLHNLWLNVDISNPNKVNVREGKWFTISSLAPAQLDSTGYQIAWSIPSNAITGRYYVAIGLRNQNDSFDIKYKIASFLVENPKDHFPITEGKLVYHSYTKYTDYNGQLFLLNFKTGVLSNISSSWNIENSINPHFSPDGTKIAFMGIEISDTRKWDIYLWDVNSTTKPRNLTVGNNKIDEDPKFSPDGSKIVFKQDGDIKIMNLNGNILDALTSDRFEEESMPYYSTDGKSILFTKGVSATSDIYLINLANRSIFPLQTIPNCQEYYPVVLNSTSYLFTRWYSSDNHKDQVYLGYYSVRAPTRLSFNDKDFESSDAYPATSNYIFFSSTRSGANAGLDLFVGNLASGECWSLDQFGINTILDELGASYYDGISTDISDYVAFVPRKFGVSQNYPNPFNPVTTITYEIPMVTDVILEIFDITGRIIDIPVNTKQQAGSYTIKFNASNYASGIYFYRFQAGNYSEVRKMVLLK